VAFGSERSGELCLLAMTDIPSEFDCTDYQRSLFRNSSSHISDRWVFRGLRCLATAYHNSLHITRVGCELWLVGCHETGQVSRVSAAQILTIDGKSAQPYTSSV
jgi:hypothetical protein